MKQTLRMKTPLYMGNGTWLEEDFTETRAHGFICGADKRELCGAASEVNTMLLALLCAAAFLWLAVGTISLPSINNSSWITAPTYNKSVRFEWAGNRGRALIQYERAHMNIQ
jgi:hypothetical protein